MIYFIRLSMNHRKNNFCDCLKFLRLHLQFYHSMFPMGNKRLSKNILNSKSPNVEPCGAPNLAAFRSSLKTYLAASNTMRVTTSVLE